MVELRKSVEFLSTWKHGKALVLHGSNNTFCSGSDLQVVKKFSRPKVTMKKLFDISTLTRPPLKFDFECMGRNLHPARREKTLVDCHADLRLRVK